MRHKITEVTAERDESMQALELACLCADQCERCFVLWLNDDGSIDMLTNTAGAYTEPQQAFPVKIREAL